GHAAAPPDADRRARRRLVIHDMRRVVGRTAYDGDARRVLIEPLDYLFERIGQIARPNERAAAVEQSGDCNGFVRFALNLGLIRIVPSCDANEVSHVPSTFL